MVVNWGLNPDKDVIIVKHYYSICKKDVLNCIVITYKPNNEEE